MHLHKTTIDQHRRARGRAADATAREGGTLTVVLLTAAAMVAEIVAGHLTGSMALLADGWHMGTHTLALGISYAAYRLARRHGDSPAFAFGTGKFGELAGYTSALFLGAAALWMIAESAGRFVHPVTIAFNEAIGVTVLGLLVNLASVWILHRSGGDHAHGHGDHDHHHHHPHDDHNFRAAYLHVIADTFTSVLAIAALLSGRFLGWAFMDPAMGVVGGLVILRWSAGLLRSSGAVLLDAGGGDDLREAIRRAVESDGDSRVADLRVWPLGSGDMAAQLTVVTGTARPASYYRDRLKDIPGLAALHVEVHSCADPDCACPKTAVASR